MIVTMLFERIAALYLNLSLRFNRLSDIKNKCIGALITIFYSDTLFIWCKGIFKGPIPKEDVISVSDASKNKRFAVILGSISEGIFESVPSIFIAFHYLYYQDIDDMDLYDIIIIKFKGFWSLISLSLTILDCYLSKDMEKGFGY